MAAGPCDREAATRQNSSCRRLWGTPHLINIGPQGFRRCRNKGLGREGVQLRPGIATEILHISHHTDMARLYRPATPQLVSVLPRS
jgi:hypothetical protein